MQRMQNLVMPPTLLHEPTHQPTNAWSVHAWPALLWQAHETEHARFHHADTRVVVPDASRMPAKGHTIWISDEPGLHAKAAVAWDWIQVAPGIVAIANPMAMVTNLRLRGDNGELLPREATARVLNLLVRTLPWQDEVHRVLADASH